MLVIHFSPDDNRISAENKWNETYSIVKPTHSQKPVTQADAHARANKRM